MDLENTEEVEEVMEQFEKAFEAVELSLLNAGLNRGCPFSPDDATCGAWCAQFEILRRTITSEDRFCSIKLNCTGVTLYDVKITH